MKNNGQFSIFVFALCVGLPAALTDCGGKATGNGNVDPKATGGVPAGVGGQTGIGGQTATVVVAPRVPTAHRPSAVSCVGVFAPPEPEGIAISDYNTCASHADCAEGVRGKCSRSGIGMAGQWYYCTYDGCDTDADCESGQVCYCSTTAAARCLSIGNCQKDSDCGNGAYSFCSPSMSWDCSGYRPIDGYHCHTASDSCMDDADCTGTDYCNFDDYAGRWRCTAPNTTCAIG